MTSPYFPAYLILLLLVFFLDKFCYNILSTFLSPKGQVLFYRRLFYFFFRRKNIQTQLCFITTMLFTKNLAKSTKWMDPTRVDKEVHKVDGHNKG